MTDPQSTDPHSAGSPSPEAPTAPPAPSAYDASPYVPPAAPSYDTAAYPEPPAAPAAAPAYTPPAYPASPYGAPANPYGASAPTGAYATPGAYPGAPAAPYGYGGYAAPRRTNGLSIAAMVLSILGFVWILPFIGSVAGAIMGHISLGQIKRTGEAGRGMALAGVIVGWVGVGLAVLGILFFIFVIAVSSRSYTYGA